MIRATVPLLLVTLIVMYRRPRHWKLLTGALVALSAALILLGGVL